VKSIPISEIPSLKGLGVVSGFACCSRKKDALRMARFAARVLREIDEEDRQRLTPPSSK
jgi:hypothetical protein